MKQSRRIWIAGVVLITGGIALTYSFLGETPPTAELYTVSRGTVSATVANTRAGTVEACRRSRLAPNAAGQVIRLLVREGDRVQAGELLLEIWHGDLVAERELVRHEIQAAENRAGESCLRADVAKREAQRLRELENNQFVSEDRLDQTSTLAKAAEQACLAAKTAVLTTRSRLRIIQANIERSLLTAPFTGTIAEVNAELGEFVTPSPTGIPTPPAVDLIDTSCLYVSAPIDEVDAPAIRLDMPATVRLDAFPEREFPALVRRIAPYVLDLEKQARTLEVEAQFQLERIDVNLLPGYSADLEILLERKTDVIAIPAESLRGEDRVLVYDPHDRVLREREIQTGLANWEVIEVTDGLRAGEKILRNAANEQLGDGSKITLPE